jgi:hypothetical protein
MVGHEAVGLSTSLHHQARNIGFYHHHQHYHRIFAGPIWRNGGRSIKGLAVLPRMDRQYSRAYFRVSHMCSHF